MIILFVIFLIVNSFETERKNELNQYNNLEDNSDNSNDNSLDSFDSNNDEKEDIFKCGEECFWKVITEELIIYGNGEMKDYSDEQKAPWKEIYGNYITSIKFQTTVVINETDQIPEVNDNFKQIKTSGEIKEYSGITTIGKNAFKEMKEIKQVIFTKSITTIREFSFKDCDKLEKIEIPDSVKKIEKGAFQSCDSLTFVIIPKNVETIEENAFESCDNLTTVEYKGIKDPCSQNINVFGNKTVIKVLEYYESKSFCGVSNERIEGKIKTNDLISLMIIIVLISLMIMIFVITVVGMTIYSCCQNRKMKYKEVVNKSDEENKDIKSSENHSSHSSSSQSNSILSTSSESSEIESKTNSLSQNKSSSRSRSSSNE